ncbi:hypothetical protein EVAR_11634_1 [Eumeta japonica]|uniref:Uncharacterized protein n=1 Tax=Eumeta variegata TaxID=151549 RepID=A0A4C1WU91_EUMVA|nr:hypothetical protein EVAR_11634_1 [Eumeta japonica]
MDEQDFTTQIELKENSNSDSHVKDPDFHCTWTFFNLNQSSSASACTCCNINSIGRSFASTGRFSSGGYGVVWLCGRSKPLVLSISDSDEFP